LASAITRPGSYGFPVYAIQDIAAEDQLYANYRQGFFEEGGCPCNTCWVRECSFARQLRQETVDNEEERAEAIRNHRKAKREIM